MTRQQQLDERNRKALERMGISSPKRFKVTVYYALTGKTGELAKRYTVTARDREDARNKAMKKFQSNEYDLDLDYYRVSQNVKET